MVNDNIEDTTFSILLQVSKDYNRDDMSSTHSKIIKTWFRNNYRFTRVLGDRIHTLITDEKL